MRRRWLTESGMLGASLVAAFAVAQLTTGATSAALVTATIGTAVVAVLHRRGALAIIVGVTAVALSSLWWGIGAATRYGLPTLTTLRSLRRSLQAARPLLVGFHIPLPHTPGIVVLSALVAGLAAVAGRVMGTHHPALSLLPAAALLLWSAILRPTTGSALAGLALGACGFLVLLTERTAARRAYTVVAAISLGTAALTVALGAADAGSGAVSSGGPAVPAVAPTALSLATDLTGLEAKDARLVLFRARTPVSTYWQVATLTTFANDQWVPDPSTEAVLNGSTPTATPLFSTRQRLFTAQVKLAAYSGRLLPVPPSTIAATGATSPVVTASGVAATAPLVPDAVYAATAIVPTAVADSRSPPTDTALGMVPAVVHSLAASITGGQSTPLDKAEALTDYFRSGRFHYTIDPPRVAAGSDPIVAFLTQTHRGSCEQFAGAFAVLARAAGLPARVAIGFTPGRPGNGMTVVRGSDAHAWPQVLIDGSWVSFEPTPQLPSGELSPPGVLGPSGLGRPNPTGPATLPHVSLPLPSTPALKVPAATVQVPAAGHSAGAHALWWTALAAILIAAVGVLAAWRRGRRTPIDRVLGSWRAIDRALSRRGMARLPSRTPTGHVRALSRVQHDEQAGAALRDMAEVAGILEGVTYGSAELSPGDAERAARASRRARRAILSGALSGSRDPGTGDNGYPHRSTVGTGSGQR